MRRLMASLSAALLFMALALVLFQPYPARTARAADINEKCNDCMARVQARFDQWRANRKYQREPIPDELREAALEMSRRYPPSLLQRVLKIQLCRLMPKVKTHARRSKRQQAQTAFFKLQPPQASLGAESLAPQTSTAYRLQLERQDGSRL